MKRISATIRMDPSSDEWMRNIRRYAADAWLAGFPPDSIRIGVSPHSDALQANVRRYIQASYDLLDKDLRGALIAANYDATRGVWADVRVKSSASPGRRTGPSSS